MMRKFSVLLILLFISPCNDLSAQTEQSKDALTWRWTWNNFQFPITDNLDGKDYTSGGELAYGRYLNRWLNLSIPLKFGKADLPLDEKGAIDENNLIGSLDALLHFNIIKTGSLIQPYLLGGGGLMMEMENDNKVNPEFPVGLGLNLRMTKGVYISAETQYRFDINDNRNQLMHAVGVKFDLGKGESKEEIADADNDGIKDDEDQCPNQAGSAALFGCPDADGDGVADKLDNCPNESGSVELGGCPDSDGDKVPNHLDECPTIAGLIENKGCPNEDQDGDGIKDAEDLCPTVPGTPYTNGCPDLDNDGIADKDDVCPTEAGLPEHKGCPDTDQDGVADPFDKCPNTKGPASNAGCPELKQEEKEVLEFAMKAVQFETGSSRLLASSNAVLDQIAGIMANYPDRKLKIGGHTDSIGTAEENLSLSQKRAKACYDYLVKKGIAASRINYEGFGETKPIGDNRFAPGREKNRRVEFEIYID
jgi:outer membrane protein OmpA-like peptidoglycan-associated protein